MDFVLNAQTGVSITIGIAMLALAAWLLYLNFRSKLHLTFAAFLLLQATLQLRPLFDLTAGSVDAGEWLAPLVLIAVPFVVPLFLLNFQQCHCIAHAHGNFAVERRIVRFFLTSLVLMAALYVWDSSLYSPSLDTGYLADASNPVGPLHMVHGLDLLSFALLALLFAREYPHSSTPIHRTSYLVVSLAFALPAAYRGAWVVLQQGLMGAPVLALPWPRIVSAAWEILAAMTVLRLVWELRRRARSVDDPVVRQEVRAFLGMTACAFATAVLAAGAGALVPAWAAALSGAFAVLWGVALPLLVTYAILKHRFFDLDRTVKKTLRRGTVAAAFVAVFFGVSEGAQTFFQSRWGPVLGLAASSLLVFALAPMMRWADRFADRALPGTQDPSTMPPVERLIFYREQVHIAWGDGTLNPKERLLLNNLRIRLEIPAEDALRIEAEAVQEAQTHRAYTPTPA